MVLTQKHSTLCLNMIVKNESKIITRLFDSVLPIIDAYCICDTGSTDNTIEIIKNYFDSKNIPGRIVHEPFKNFAHNRTFALKAAVGLSDYVLLLDADMVIEINSFNKTTLGKFDNYSLLQGNDSFFYQNMRIVRNNGLYKYLCVTHEYVDVPPNSINTLLKKDVIFIRDIGDGGAKTDKYERDIRLLTDGLKEEPNNCRYYFYLANSYHDTEKFELAIETYKKRIELKGWQEEVWYSYYRLGLCYKRLNQFHTAIYYWLQGLNYYPDRLEGIFEIVLHYRISNQPKLSGLYFNLIKDILDKSNNREHFLFLYDDIYKYKLYYEYAVIANCIGVHNINDEIIKILNHSKETGLNNNLIENMKFYKYILKQNFRITLDNNFTTVINNENITLKSSSSCLIPILNNNGYHLNVRYVNYTIDNEGLYHDCDKNIITVNKYILLNNEFKILKEDWIELDFDNRRYIGVEDVKIFTEPETKDVLFIGTGFHKNQQIGIVSGYYDIQQKRMNINELTCGFNTASCEKNWIFFELFGLTHIIYQWQPLTVCKVNKSNNVLDGVLQKNMPAIFAHFRGSTCGYKFNNETWFVTHLVSYEKPRQYYHIIVVFDDKLNLLRYSAPFKFEGEPIEYCLSILVENNRVIMNYSTWDRTTKIAIYDKYYIEQQLKYKE